VITQASVVNHTVCANRYDFDLNVEFDRKIHHNHYRRQRVFFVADVVELNIHFSLFDTARFPRRLPKKSILTGEHHDMAFLRMKQDDQSDERLHVKMCEQAVQVLDQIVIEYSKVCRYAKHNTPRWLSIDS
jgi:hypothetical protein